MVVKAYRVQDDVGGYIESALCSESELPEYVEKFDIIRLEAKRAGESKGIRFFVHPEEAVHMATALLNAHAVAVERGVADVGPDICVKKSFWKKLMRW